MELIFRMKFLLLLAAISEAAKVLVLYENPQVKVSHATVMDALEAHGFDITFKVNILTAPK